MMMIRALGTGPRRSVIIAALAILWLMAIWHQMVYKSKDERSSLFDYLHRPAPSAANESDPASTHPIANHEAPLLPPLPEEYNFRSKDQKFCDLFYGEGYLRHAASHQLEYCSPGSTSSITGLSAPRIPPPQRDEFWLVDIRLIWLAQGVLVQPGPNGLLDHHFHTHCTPKNLTEEEKHDPGVEDVVHNKLDMDGRWEFRPDALAECSAEKNDGSWVVILDREPTSNIWHKLMGLWMAKLTLDTLRVAVNPKTGRPYIGADTKLRVLTLDEREGDAWEEYTPGVLGVEKLERAKDLSPGSCLGNVVSPWIGHGSPFWIALLEVDFHDSCGGTRLLIDTLVRQLMGVMGIEPRPAGDIHEEPSITIVNRTGTRKWHDFKRLETLVRDKYPKSEITIADFNEMSLKEQVQLMQKTDVLVGYHGAGMTHLLFLRPGSAVVEFTVLPNRKWRHVSNLRGHAHFEVPTLEREVYMELTQGEKIPAGWEPGKQDWGKHEFVYVEEREWLAGIDTGVRQQRWWRYDHR